MPVAERTRELGASGGKKGGGELIRMGGDGGGSAIKAIHLNVECEIEIPHEDQAGTVGLV